ncbi:MAG: hypothetical protein ACYC9O_05440 [Candidatus Latescibacterota bacterium]
MVRGILRGILAAGTAAVISSCGSEVSERPAEPASGSVYREGPVQGKMVDAGFLYGETNYHAVQQASDGNVYYAINSHAHGQSASLFRYDPRSGEVKLLGSMNPATGEDGTKVFNQDKIHCDLYEMNGKLWFSTQGGSYGGGNYGPYPGGHFLSYDLKTEKITDFGIAAPAKGSVPGEGIVCMGMDTKRGRMYGITWPGMLFVYYDAASGKMKNFGKKVETPGITDLTAVPGNRAIGVDPRTGNVYWHNMDETISRYVYDTDAVEILEKPRLDLPIFKLVKSGGFDKALWRAIRWSDSQQRLFGVETGAEYLFSYEPESGEIEVFDRIAAGPVRKTGRTGGASLAFELSPDGKTVYYVTGAQASLPDGSRRRELHLVTYEIPTRTYTDHGPIVLDDGRYPNGCSGLDAGSDGIVYLVCNIPLVNLEGEREKGIIQAHFADMPAEKLKGAYEVNLVVVPDPLKKQ